ncbi:granulocyte colony-stimulating factor [Sigmodon hispidus]
MYKGPLELGPDRTQSYSPDHPESMAQLSAQSRMKLMALQLLLWHSPLVTGQEAVVPLVSATSLPPPVPLPQSFLLKSLEQVRRIQGRNSVLLEQLCAAYRLCHPQELVLLGHSLGIPQAPLNCCSRQALQLTKCLSQLHSGLFLYQGLLQALAGISSEVGPTLDMLLLDVANFATTIWQQMESLGVVPTVQPTQSTMPTFTSAFQRRAGGVLATAHLQSFLERAHCALDRLA